MSVLTGITGAKFPPVEAGGLFVQMAKSKRTCPQGGRIRFDIISFPSLNRGEAARIYRDVGQRYMVLR